MQHLYAKRPAFLSLDALDAATQRFIKSFRYPIPTKNHLTITGRQLLDFVYGQRPSLRKRAVIFGFGKFNSIDAGALAEIEIVFNPLTKEE